MSVASLVAKIDPVVIDIEAGQTTGVTNIEYVKEPAYVIWHKWKPGDWVKKSISVTDPSDPANKHGTFNSPPLAPGDIYDASIWEKGVDPNDLPDADIPPEPFATVTVFALKKRPSDRDFMSDQNTREGGTYREHDFSPKCPFAPGWP